MVFTRENAEGFVIAWAELRLVDEAGQEDPKGLYVWIHEAWVHKDFRTKSGVSNIFKDFIEEARDRFPWAKSVYWEREKYGKRPSQYSREKILRRTNDGRRKETRLFSTSSTGATTNPCAV